MRGLTRRIRSRRDYVVFQATNERPIQLSAAGCSWGLGRFSRVPRHHVVDCRLRRRRSVFARDVRQPRRSGSNYKFSAIVAPFPLMLFRHRPSYPRAIYLHIPNRGAALLSNEIDQTFGVPRSRGSGT